MPGRYRIPTEAEAESLADRLLAAGYPATEAVRNWRSVQLAEGDLCLLLEGPHMPLYERVLDELGPDDDDNPYRPVANWKSALGVQALLTILVRNGVADAAPIRAEDLAYMQQHWPEL